MLKLLLVGDKPSRKNADPRVAFVGTASFKRIQKWLEEILDENANVVMINRVDPEFARILVKASLERRKIIALGEEAANAILSHGVMQFFKMPHPSGRNRKLNNKKYVDKVLADCKAWIKKD